MTDEFSLIARYFAPLSGEIGDDCAILDLSPGERLALSTDTLVEGTHFDADAPPDQVAYRAVVSALSDLAAMGAEPRAMLLALTLPAADDTFLQQFSRGLLQATQAYGVELIGGDTTRGPLTITCTVMGMVPEKRALLRSGARPGDQVFISGTTGDAAAALTVIGGTWPGDARYRSYLLQRFYRPSARIELGRQLLELASSAIDVSDGVLADAGHLCEQSGVAIRIHADHLPLSPALESVPDRNLARRWSLAGGEDYELLFTVPERLAAQVPEGCARIGEVVEGAGVECDFEVGRTGYRHFSEDDGDELSIPPARHPEA